MEKNKKIVVFTGAGISQESGLKTFRDVADGLWNEVKIEDICTHEAWLKNPELCVDFYNKMRKFVLEAQPNEAHLAITRLQQQYPDLQIITQNVDDLHERAGSNNITHLHGEIVKLRSSINEVATVPISGWEQKYGERHPDGSLLRPYVVFFGEGVPYFPAACEIVKTADILIVVGTSLNVFPAASLLEYINTDSKIYFVDPGDVDFGPFKDQITHIKEKASSGVVKVVNELLS